MLTWIQQNKPLKERKNVSEKEGFGFSSRKDFIYRIWNIWNGEENFKSKKPRRKRNSLRIVEGKGGWESGGQ